MIRSERRASRTQIVTALSIVALLTASLAGILIGPAAIDVGDVLALLGGGPGAETTWQQTIIWQVRLPRVLTGALVGAALAVSGAVLQGLFRNPLASPSVLGVSSGASLGAVIAIFFGLAATNVWALPTGAFTGALLTLFAVYTMATHRGHTPLATLLLAGIAVGAFNTAMGSFLIAIAMQTWEVGRTIIYWTMGGLDGSTWDHVKLISPVLVIGLAVILLHQRELDAMLIGEVHAAATGVDVPRTRILLLIATALLTGAAVAVAGGIGFIGLVVPHIVRLMAGPRHRALLPLSAIVGATILVLADLLIRGLLAEHNIPIGVITAAMGAPFFLFLLLRQQGRGLSS